MKLWHEISVAIIASGMAGAFVPFVGLAGGVLLAGLLAVLVFGVSEVVETTHREHREWQRYEEGRL